MEKRFLKSYLKGENVQGKSETPHMKMSLRIHKTEPLSFNSKDHKLY